MNKRLTAGLFWVMGAAYVGVLIWADRGSDAAEALRQASLALPVLGAMSFAALGVRYLRWHWLLVHAGHRCKAGYGFLAYLSGFAYTLTPGKVGELVRLRYLGPMGVPPHVVISAFFYERALDLLVVLSLASLAVHDSKALGPAIAFVAIVLLLLLACMRHPRPLVALQTRWERAGWHRLAGWLSALREGLTHTACWMTWRHLLVSFGLGLVAWGLTSAAFVFLLQYLEIVLPWPAALSMYPLSMLAGAASMLPGGIGSTEVALVALLMQRGVSLQLAAVAAVTIRLATLWLATIFGFAAMLVFGWLEARAAPTAPRPTAGPRGS